MDNEQELLDKAAYAAFLLRAKGDTFRAAQLLYPTDTGKALRIHNYWPIDPVVMAEKQRLIDSGEDINFVPSKVEVLTKLWGIIENVNVEPRDKIAASKLYAEMMGFIKPLEAIAAEDNSPKMPVYKLVDK